MAEKPKYMVTTPPGAAVAGVAFVRPGEVFTAPSDDYVPSRTFRPANEEARAALEKLYDEVKATLEKRERDASKPEDKAAIRRLIERLAEDARRHLVIVEIAREEPKVERGITLAELAQLDSHVTEPKKTAPAPAPSGKRAADK